MTQTTVTMPDPTKVRLNCGGCGELLDTGRFGEWVHDAGGGRGCSGWDYDAGPDIDDLDEALSQAAQAAGGQVTQAVADAAMAVTVAQWQIVTTHPEQVHADAWTAANAAIAAAAR